MKEKKKLKILTLSDDPRHPSGVAHQTRLMVENLLKTDKYQFISLGGAIKHPDYRPVKFQEWGDDWIVIPVDGYGKPEQIREALKVFKPDILWFMTDPRFYTWLWEMEDEIRPHVPMVYHTLWDSPPTPKFNSLYWSSNDVNVCINSHTYDFIKEISPKPDLYYLGHTVDTKLFKKLENFDARVFKEKHFGSADKFVCFFNSRNARRKSTGSLIYWFKTFLDLVGHDKAMLLMHTEPLDPNGQNLEVIVNDFNLTNGQVLFSEQKMPIEDLVKLYNVADVLINISDAEGWGLSVTEAKACETPVMCTYTGGMKDQIKDEDDNVFGRLIKPVAQALIGSQQVPYIFEDRISEQDFVNTLKELYQMTPEERAELGRKGREDILRRFNFDDWCRKWDEIFQTTHEKFGSWETRKGYEPWVLKEIV